MSEVKKVEKASDGKGKVSRRLLRPHNYKLPCGVYRYSRSKVYRHWRADKFAAEVAKKAKAAKAEAVKAKKAAAVKKKTVKRKTKKVKKPGTKKPKEKTRKAKRAQKKLLAIAKEKANRPPFILYPTQEKVVRKRTDTKRPYQGRVRKSLQPGRVLIIIDGRMYAKRVILLKVLRSNLLLVTGPYKFNGCPLRRVCPRRVIATSKCYKEIASLKLPKELKDDLFRKPKQKKQKKEEGADIFVTEKEKHTITEERKVLQKKVDKMVIDVLKKDPEKRMLFQYLSTPFYLQNKMYPHNMKF